MTDTLAARSASLAASAAVLGIAAFAALTFTITLRTPPPPQGGTIITSVEPQPPAPTPPNSPPPETNLTIEDFALLAPPLGPAIASGAFSATPWTLTTSGPVIIADPTWVERPRDLARYYPDRARLRGVEGEALLDCRVDVFGALACRVERETPAGWGFGEAALRIAADHRMAPATRDGLPVEGRYRMRVPFNLN